MVLNTPLADLESYMPNKEILPFTSGTLGLDTGLASKFASHIMVIKQKTY